MDDITLACLGDKEAQERVTERGELLPCSDCGGPAKFNVVGKVQRGGSCGWDFEIVCQKCGKRTRNKCYNLMLEMSCSGVISTTKDERELAIGEWNTRHVLLTPEQIKRLEELE